MKRNFKTLFNLFSTFFKIGLFTFGGGMAMLPLIQRETVERHKWINEKDILEILAISESTPGPIAINTATFVGMQVAGFWGSFFATLGVVVPSFIIILIISAFFSEFSDNKIVGYAFFGVRAGVVALVINALLKLFRACDKNIISYIVIAAAFVLACIFKINVIIIIVCSALLGIAVTLISREGKK